MERILVSAALQPPLVESPEVLVQRLAVAAALDEASVPFDPARHRDDLTCPVCREVFVDPVLLGCGHMFCDRCLAGAAAKGVHVLLRCPTCRADACERPLHVPALGAITRALFPREVATRLRDSVADIVRRQELEAIRTRVRVELEQEQRAVAPRVPIMDTEDLAAIAARYLDDVPALEPIRARPLSWWRRALIALFEFIDTRSVGHLTRHGYVDVWTSLRLRAPRVSLIRECARVIMENLRAIMMFNLNVIGALAPVFLAFVCWALYRIATQ